jgi:glucose-6-phosphate 1-dehydrogenase
VRDEKTKVLSSLRPYTSADLEKAVVRAQYISGSVDNKVVPGYLEEKGVKPNSRTETYAALRLYIDNWRWSGVPFYIRTGKRLPKRVTEVAIQFRPVPHFVFSRTRSDVIEPNVLSIRIQPDEGINLRFIAKTPGHGLILNPADLEFGYGRSFSVMPSKKVGNLSSRSFKLGETIPFRWRPTPPAHGDQLKLTS